MAKASRLSSVAMHFDRFVSEGGPNEARNDHSVLPGLTRTDRVKEAYDHDRKARFLPVRQSEKLVQCLSAGIGPPMLVRRTGKQIVFFLERHRNAFAVNFGSARYQNPLAIT